MQNPRFLFDQPNIYIVCMYLFALDEHFIGQVWKCSRRVTCQQLNAEVQMKVVEQNGKQVEQLPSLQFFSSAVLSRPAHSNVKFSSRVQTQLNSFPKFDRPAKFFKLNQHNFLFYGRTGPVLFGCCYLRTCSAFCEFISDRGDFCRSVRSQFSFLRTRRAT